MRALRNKRRDEFQTAAAWTAGCAIGYLLCSLLGSLLGQGFLLHWMNGPGAGAAPAAEELVIWWVNLGCSLLGRLLPIWLGLRLGHLPRQELYLQVPRRKQVIPALLVYLGGAQLIGLLAAAVGQATGSTQQIPVPQSMGAALPAFLTLCVTPAILEEVLFRGVMQGFLRPYGLWLAIVGQAVPFALLHGSASAAVFALLAGLFFGWLAERTGSILPGMVLHLVNNTLAFVQMLLLTHGARGVAQLLSGLYLIVFPILAVLVLVWWLRQGGHRGRLERVSRVDRLLYSAPWMIAQAFLLVYCFILA